MGSLHSTVQPKLTYVSPYAIPSIKADAGQDVAMCMAFSDLGWKVLLRHRAHRDPSPTRDLFEHYGVDRKFTSLPHTQAASQHSRGWIVRDIGSTITFALRALRSKSDLYYTRDPIVAWVLAQSRGKVVWEAMSFPDRSRLPFARLFLRSRGHHYAFAITAALARDLESVAATGTSVTALPVGVDIERYRASPTSPSHPRSVHIPSGRPVACYTGWMRADRGVDVIVRAAALLPSVTFLLVGGREEEIGTLRRLATELKAHNVRLIGAIAPTEVPLYQHAADILVLPQSGNSRHLRYHVSPAKLFEYMAAARPIVAADLPCMREIVTNNREAILVDPESPTEWAAAIDSVLKDPALSETLVQHASQRVTHFDWSERVRKVLRGIGDR